MKTPIEAKPLRKMYNTLVDRFVETVRRTAKVIEHREVHIELEVVGKIEIDAEYDFDQEKLLEVLAEAGVANLPIEGIPVSAKVNVNREGGTERTGEGPFKSFLYIRAKMWPKDSQPRRRKT